MWIDPRYTDPISYPSSVAYVSISFLKMDTNYNGPSVRIFIDNDMRTFSIHLPIIDNEIQWLYLIEFNVIRDIELFRIEIDSLK
jgi:hypothetical protein